MPANQAIKHSVSIIMSSAIDKRMQRARRALIKILDDLKLQQKIDEIEQESKQRREARYGISVANAYVDEPASRPQTLKEHRKMRV